MATKVLIVESPSKAKTIARYLGSDFDVVASMGHVRDLEAKQGSVNPDKDFAMTWSSEPRAQKQLKKIKEVLTNAQEVYLATDPDREGEAISWHLMEIFTQNKQFKNLPFHRVVFHEITQKAITESIKNARSLNHNLVNAYLARVALDYLVGYTLSPILWRKLPGSKSAGRVQSVALRLIVDREIEISNFISQEYWSIFGLFDLNDNKNIKTRLHTFEGKKLNKLDIKDASHAQSITSSLKESNFILSKIETTKRTRNPLSPFTTSTLQQDGARRLGFSAKQTMMIAQQLYEGIDINNKRTGLITYMRTDSTTLAQEFITEARQFIESNYGDKYLPAQPNIYKTKARNAQEAHEAIRPTDITLTPKKISQYLDDKQLKLYTLVWQRALACQMTKAKFNNMTISISDKTMESKDVSIFKASGSVMIFDGFLKLYADINNTDETKDEDDKTLPNFLNNLEEGMKALLQKFEENQHFTLPRSRYNEASLVQKMEELGIGRPSTYAGIITTLQARNYVEKVNKKFIPQILGIMVSIFLNTQFIKYVDYDFTANLEDELDKISNGVAQWKEIVTNFWQDFHQKIEKSKDLTIPQVLEDINRVMADFLYKYLIEVDEIKIDQPRKPIKDSKDKTTHTVCPGCNDGVLVFRLGKFGPFISCSNYPDCKKVINPRKEIKKSSQKGIDEQKSDEEQESTNTQVVFDEKLPLTLGVDGNCSITLRKGPYGYYLQWDKEENKGVKNKTKPKRVSVAKNIDVTTIDLAKALEMGKYPKVIGLHPETKEEISIGIGRYGPYVKYHNKFYSAKGVEDIDNLSIDESLDIIAKKKG